MSFYPPQQIVPAGLDGEEFILRPLKPAHVELDYAALMVSNQMLRRWSGSSWPADDFTLAENLADLQMHDAEHRRRTAFTFTVLTPDKSTCLGCVYIEPLRRLLRQAQADETEVAAIPEDQAVVRFWVRQPRLADGLDRRLFEALSAWLLREWAFTGVFFRTNEHDRRQVELLGQSGWQPCYILDVAGRSGRYIVYQQPQGKHP